MSPLDVDPYLSRLEYETSEATHFKRMVVFAVVLFFCAAPSLAMLDIWIDGIFFFGILCVKIHEELLTGATSKLYRHAHL